MDAESRARAAGVALIRLAATAFAALCVGLVLATFMVGAQQTDEQVGLDRIQVAVFFFGPIAAIATLAFIVVLALTRPRSMAIPTRRRGARATAIGYTVVGLIAGLLTLALAWAVVLAIVTVVCAAGAWWFLRRSEAR
jgi:hypothetical protein